MMHVISGKYKGRRIETLPGKEIRPTTGRAKEAMFNILTHGRFYGEASPLPGARVIDIFCGSGALGLEALSRGAEHVTFVDENPKALEITRKNIEHIGVTGSADFLRADSTRVPPTRKDPCTLAFVDPPYETGVAAKAVENLISGKWLAPGAIIVIEQSKREDLKTPVGCTGLDERIYNSTKIIILEYAGI